MVMPKLQVIGGGKMGEALLAGLLDGGWAPAGESRRSRAADRAAQLVARFPGVTVAGDPGGRTARCVAVKPGDVEAPAGPWRRRAGRVLSIAAGVTIADGSRRPAPGHPRGAGHAQHAGARRRRGGGHRRRAGDADEADLAWAEGILGAVGTVVRVAEALLDAVTGLSGSGPAYVFLVAEALIEAGVLAGLPRPDGARRWRCRPCSASARLLAESGEGPEALRAAVTSPGGTTAAGLRALEAAGVRRAFLEAVGPPPSAVASSGGADGQRRSAQEPRPHFPHQQRWHTVPPAEGRGVPHGPCRAPGSSRVAEVADLLRVSTMTVYRLIKAGSCAPSGSASRTGCARTTSTATWPTGTPRPADRGDGRRPGCRR